MTMGLKPILKDLLHPQLSLDYFTAPSAAPPSIDDEATSATSTSVTFSALLPLLALNPHTPHNPALDGPYSAYLVACFSPHPLTRLLRDYTGAPVLNIFEASLLHARALGLPFGIVTTGQYWEGALTHGAREFFAGGAVSGTDNQADEPFPSRGVLQGFVGVRSTGLSAFELHSTSKEMVSWRIVEASAHLVRNGARIIIMGCAGMAGMEEAVRTGAMNEGKEVHIIDGVRAGVVLLEGLVKTKATSEHKFNDP